MRYEVSVLQKGQTPELWVVTTVEARDYFVEENGTLTFRGLDSIPVDSIAAGFWRRVREVKKDEA